MGVLKMNLFAKLKEKREALKEYRLKNAENKAFKLEREAKEEKHYSSLISRQNEAKATIQEARRVQHPLLFKISDNVKKNLEKNKNDKTYKKIATQSNVFTNSNAKNPFTNSKISQPYYMKAKNKKPYWLK